MPEKREVEIHKPLLADRQIKWLNGVSQGLNLNESSGQVLFLAEVQEKGFGMTIDHVLEYLVNNRDVLVGDVIPDIKLSKQCNAARRIHWAAEQLKRHKQHGRRPAVVQVSKEMAGSHA